MPSEHRVRYASSAAKKRRVAGRPPKHLPPSPEKLKLEYGAPEWARILNFHIRNTDSKAQAAVMQINLLRAEVQSLTEQVKCLSSQVLRSHQFILRLLDDPEAAHHAEAIARSLRIEKFADPEKL